MLKVVSVKPEKDYWLSITFDNGETKLFDVSPYLRKGVFKELTDQDYFRRVSVKFDSIVWPNEQDFSPDTLYILGKESAE